MRADANGSIQVGHVDDSNPSNFHVVAGQLITATLEMPPFPAPYSDNVIGDQSVSPLDETKGRLTFSNRRVPRNQDAYAEDLDECPVQGCAWRKGIG